MSVQPYLLDSILDPYQYQTTNYLKLDHSKEPTFHWQRANDQLFYVKTQQILLKLKSHEQTLRASIIASYIQLIIQRQTL